MSKMTTFENEEIQINGKILSRKKLNYNNEIIQTIIYVSEKKQKNKNKKKWKIIILTGIGARHSSLKCVTDKAHSLWKEKERSREKNCGDD